MKRGARRLWPAFLLTAVAAGCAADRAAPPPASATAPAAVDAVAQVTRDGDGWAVEYRFARPSPVWAFTRSSLPRESERSWRVETMVVETPGVRLERRGHFDVLVAENGRMPPVVRLRFTPFSRDILSGYDAALAFTDGSVALYDGQFDMFPVASLAAADALPREPHDIPAARARTRIEFGDRRDRVLYGGERRRSVAVEGIGTYVLFGRLQPVVTTDMAAIIDPALPAWLRAFLNRTVPEVIARHAATLGPPPPGPKPTIMVSWAGPTPRQVSMGGSVLRGLIVMRFEGEGVLEERREVGDFARWFVAHEGAHFWLGQTIGYSHPREAWITEGGADLLAVRLVQSMDPSYDWKAKLNQLIADCASLSKDRGVENAYERREDQAHYACGALFGLLVEQRSGRPFSEFVRALIDANREERVVSRADWLAMARARTGDAALIAWVETMLDRGFADPAAAIAAELQRARIPFERGEGGLPRLI